MRISTTDLDLQTRRHTAIFDHILSLGIPLDTPILDVGCGQGLLARRLLDRGFSNIAACDRVTQQLMPPDSFKMLSKTTYMPLDLDVEGLAIYPDQFFNLVICSDVLEHLENPTHTLRGIGRILSPQGIALITIPNAFNIFERVRILRTGNSRRYKAEDPTLQRGHISMFSSQVLGSLFARAGLEIVSALPGTCYWRGRVWFPGRRWNRLFSYDAYFVLRRKYGYSTESVP